MAKKMFLMEGNLCGDRVRLGRAMQKPPTFLVKPNNFSKEPATPSAWPGRLL